MEFDRHLFTSECLIRFLLDLVALPFIRHVHIEQADFYSDDSAPWAEPVFENLILHTEKIAMVRANSDFQSVGFSGARLYLIDLV